MVNKGMISTKCPRCNKIEDWNHGVQCEAILDMKQNFIQTLKEKLAKEVKNN